MERHEKKEAVVISIFLRPCDFKGTPFEKLQGLPKNAKAVTTFENQDEAFLEIASGVRKVIEELSGS